MNSEYYLVEAYTKYYYALIKVAMEHFGEQTDKAFDCLQDVMLRLLQRDYPYERTEHAFSIICKSIQWQAYRMKTQRKKWGAFRERSYDFTSKAAQDKLDDEVTPTTKRSLEYWPQSNRYFNHISKLNPYHQQLIKFHMEGVGNTEVAFLLNKSSKDVVGSSKNDAFKMLRNFRVASTKRSLLERSQKRQGADDRTDKIMQMTAEGIPDKIIAERLGLGINNVRCRRFDRKKLLEKIKNQ